MHQQVEKQPAAMAAISTAHPTYSKKVPTKFIGGPSLADSFAFRILTSASGVYMAGRLRRHKLRVSGSSPQGVPVPDPGTVRRD